nr:FtsK/SpoIIIE domain-containing protein [Microbacterium barkeri]
MDNFYIPSDFPSGMDFSNPKHVALAGQSLARQGEHLYAFVPDTLHALTCAPGEGRSAMELADSIPVLSGGSDALDRTARLAKEQGLALVFFDGHEAAAAPLLSYVVPLRQKIARILSEGGKSTKPHEVHVEVTKWSAEEPRPDEIQVRARLLNLDATTTGNLWKSVMGQIPELTGVWRSSFDASSGVVTWRHGDPLSQGIAYRWNEPVSYNAIPTFADENGNTVNLGLYERNILLGGVPGSGKSGGATALLVGISRLENCALVGLDPKRVELNMWRDRFSVIAKKDGHASEVLAALLEEMERRYEWLEQNDLKKVPFDRFHEKPLIVILIDELADLVSVGVTKEEKAAEAQRSTAIRRLIAKGRAAGIVVITATQKPSSDVIPTSLRDLIQQRVAFATTNREMTETILGSGASQIGGLSHEIPTEQPGTAYILNEGSRIPKRVRAMWIPDEEVAGIAAQTAHLRVPLPFLPSEDGGSSAASTSSSDSGDEPLLDVPALDWGSPEPAVPGQRYEGLFD